jgi:hypothetical protein
VQDAILNSRDGIKKKPISLQKQKELIAKIKKNEKEKKKIFENEFDMTCEADLVFLRDFLVPYLSNVFRSLLARSKTEYLPLWRVKEYLGLQGILGMRMVELMNENDDERIDHDEWLPFMLNIIFGSFE